MSDFTEGDLTKDWQNYVKTQAFSCEYTSY